MEKLADHFTWNVSTFNSVRECESWFHIAHRKRLLRRGSLAFSSPPQGVEKSRRQPGITGRRPCCLASSCECHRDISPLKWHRIKSLNSIFSHCFLFFALRIDWQMGKVSEGFPPSRGGARRHIGTVAISKNVACMCTFSNIIKTWKKDVILFLFCNFHYVRMKQFFSSRHPVAFSLFTSSFSATWRRLWFRPSCFLPLWCRSASHVDMKLYRRSLVLNKCHFQCVACRGCLSWLRFDARQHRTAHTPRVLLYFHSRPLDDQKRLSSVIRGQPTPLYVSSSGIGISTSQIRGRESVSMHQRCFYIELNFVH